MRNPFEQQTYVYIRTSETPSTSLPESSHRVRYLSSSLSENYRTTRGSSTNYGRSSNSQQPQRKKSTIPFFWNPLRNPPVRDRGSTVEQQPLRRSTESGSMWHPDTDGLITAGHTRSQSRSIEDSICLDIAAECRGELPLLRGDAPKEQIIIGRYRNLDRSFNGNRRDVNRTMTSFRRNLPGGKTRVVRESGMPEDQRPRNRSAGTFVSPLTLEYPNMDTSDLYAVIFLYPFLFSIGLLSFVAFIPLYFPIHCFIWCYGLIVPPDSILISRNRCFWIVAVIAFCLGSLLILAFVFWLLLIWTMICLLCLPYFLLLNWWNLNASFQAIQPFSQIEYARCSWSDMVTVLTIITIRRGCFAAIEIPLALALCPLYKYGIYCNFFLHRIEKTSSEVWSKPLAMPSSNIYKALKRSVSLAKEGHEDLDEPVFAVQYPFVPDSRQDPTVLGVEYLQGFCCFLQLPCITHVKHNFPGLTRSPGARGVYSTSMNYFNPLTPLCGYSETNIRKVSMQIEHPMWCIVGTSYFPQRIFRSIDDFFFSTFAEFSENIRVNSTSRSRWHRITGNY